LADWKTIRRSNDWWCGLLFLAVGIAAVGFGRNHPIGTAMRMGPAYFPMWLGSILAVIGAAVVIRAAFRPGPPLERFAYRKIALVLGSTVLFGLLLRRTGFALSLIVLVILSAYASRSFRWPAATTLAVTLAAGCIVVFVWLLKLPIPILGPWLGG
jgi:hypothetical protein